MTHVQAIVEEALKLPASTRGQIIHELIQSLDADGAEPADVVEKAWADELIQRASDAHKEEGVDLNAACDALEAKRQRGAK
jgi:hypothetical protein